MREIKFRAWYPLTKKWLENVAVWDDGSFGGDIGNVSGYSADDGCILMQYTGLHDKNGKEIYEGDIIRLNDDFQDWLAVVEFGNPNGYDSWGFQLKPIKEISVNHEILLWVETEDGVAFSEVIGNIYENPALLSVPGSYGK